MEDSNFVQCWLALYEREAELGDNALRRLSRSGASEQIRSA